jgi:hypothetical protein
MITKLKKIKISFFLSKDEIESNWMFTKGMRKKKEIKRIRTKIEETKNNKYRLNSKFLKK